MEFGKPRPIPPPIPIEHAGPIMLLERLIQETWGDLDGLDAYCEMFRKSDEWKEQVTAKTKQASRSVGPAHLCTNTIQHELALKVHFSRL